MPLTRSLRRVHVAQVLFLLALTACQDPEPPKHPCTAGAPAPARGAIAVEPVFVDELPADGLDRAIGLVQDPLDDAHGVGWVLRWLQVALVEIEVQ